MLRVWPLWQRALHWVLAAAVVTALFTHHGGGVHEVAGYIALAAAVLRLSLGWLGPAAARFSTFVRGPSATWAYARQVWHRAAPRHLNHNPLGGWMVCALLSLSVLGGASGALYVTDTFWGFGWLIALHAASTWPLVALVVLHLAGVALASWQHQENLIAAMVHGKKPKQSQDRQDNTAVQQNSQ